MPSKLVLQKIAKSGRVPAIGYAYVESKEKVKKEDKDKFVCTSIAIGKKNTQSSNTDEDTIDDNTRFPASSLGKIVFTYLVLQLVKKKQIDLDEPLHQTLQYKRFLVKGEYPEKAKQLTARDVLSHTTGLPNFGSNLNLSSTLSFDTKSELGKGYSYSGEAFLYLQKIIEIKTGKNLEMLAQENVFAPLGMNRSTFFPPPEDDTNIVKVHTELGKPTAIYEGNPSLNAAGSLLTTVDDFSKFMAAWLENMDDPVFKQAFEPTSPDATCGLGWHIYRDKDQVIAYQWGENPNTRSFIAINLKDKKGVAFFTNSENGFSIANQISSSPDLAPIGNMQALFKSKHWSQSDDPGWKETIEGKVAEDQGEFAVAKDHFEKALELAPNEKSKQLRLKWFNEVHQTTQENTVIDNMKMFTGMYTNSHKDGVEILIKNNSLIFKQFGQETKLVQISKTDFLPEKDQFFKISFNNDQMIIHFIHCPPKFLDKQQPLQKSQENSQLTSSIAMVLKKLDSKLASHLIQRQQIDIESNKKITKDDAAFQSTKEKRAAEEFSTKTEKEHVTSTDDFNITYGKRLSI